MVIGIRSRSRSRWLRSSRSPWPRSASGSTRSSMPRCVPGSSPTRGSRPTTTFRAAPGRGPPPDGRPHVRGQRAPHGLRAAGLRPGDGRLRRWRAVEPPALAGALAAVSPDLRPIVRGGELGYAWQDLAGESVLVVGGRQGGPPDLFFVFPAEPVRPPSPAAGRPAGGWCGRDRFALLAAWVIARGACGPWPRPARGAPDRRRRPFRAGPGPGPRRARPVGRGVQPDGRLARGDDRAARGLAAQNRGSSPTWPTSWHAADRPGRRGLTPRAGSRTSCRRRPAARQTPRGRRAPAAALVDDLMEISRFDAGAEQLATEPWTSRRGDRRRGGAPSRAQRAAAGPTRGGDRTAPARPDHRQPARQRPVPRAGCPWRSRSGDPRGRPDHRGRPGAWGARRRPPAPLRAVLQGRPARTRQLRSGPRDRRRARDAPRRDAAGAARPGGGLVFQLMLPVSGPLPPGHDPDTGRQIFRRNRKPKRGPSHQPITGPRRKSSSPSSRRALAGARAPPSPARSGSPATPSPPAPPSEGAASERGAPGHPASGDHHVGQTVGRAGDAPIAPRNNPRAGPGDRPPPYARPTPTQPRPLPRPRSCAPTSSCERRRQRRPGPSPPRDPHDARCREGRAEAPISGPSPADAVMDGPYRPSRSPTGPACSVSRSTSGGPPRTSRARGSGGGGQLGAAGAGAGHVDADPVPDGRHRPIRLDGQPVETLSAGGGVPSAGAARRTSPTILPAILVDRPAWGAAARQPGGRPRHHGRLRGHVPRAAPRRRGATSSPTSRSWPRAGPAVVALRPPVEVYRPKAQ